MTHEKTKSGRCRTCAAASQRALSATPYGFVTELLRGAQKRAKKRGQTCTLTHGEIVQMFLVQSGRCQISRMPLTLRPKSDWQMSIECVNPNLGYTKANCALICVEFQSACNRPRSVHNQVVEFNHGGDAQWSRGKFLEWHAALANRNAHWERIMAEHQAVFGVALKW